MEVINMSVLEIADRVFTPSFANVRNSCFAMYKYFNKEDETKQFIAMFSLAEPINIEKAVKLVPQGLPSCDIKVALDTIQLVKKYVKTIALPNAWDLVFTELAQPSNDWNFFVARVCTVAKMINNMLNVPFEGSPRRVAKLPMTQDMQVIKQVNVTMKSGSKRTQGFFRLGNIKNQYRDTGLILTFKANKLDVKAKLLLDKDLDKGCLLFPEGTRVTPIADNVVTNELRSKFCYSDGKYYYLVAPLVLSGLVSTSKGLIQGLSSTTSIKWCITGFDSNVVEGVNDALMNADIANFTPKGHSNIDVDYLSGFISWKK